MMNKNLHLIEAEKQPGVRHTGIVYQWWNFMATFSGLSIDFENKILYNGLGSLTKVNKKFSIYRNLKNRRLLCKSVRRSRI